MLEAQGFGGFKIFFVLPFTGQGGGGGVFRIISLFCCVDEL